MTTPHKGHRLVDLDGTLAFYDEWRGVDHIGEPIKPMIERVKKWLEAGDDVRIFTARVFPLDEATPDTLFFPAPGMSAELVRAWQCVAFIREWCEKHLGRRLTITCRKDFHTTEIWDDRAVGVMLNKGIDRETLLSWHLLRVLQAARMTVTDGVQFGPAADAVAARIKGVLDGFDDARADLDGALDALNGVKCEKPNDASLVRHAVQSLTKALKAINRSTLH